MGSLSLRSGDLPTIPRWLCRLASSSLFPPPMQPKLRGSDFYSPISSTSPISRAKGAMS